MIITTTRARPAEVSPRGPKLFLQLARDALESPVIPGAERGWVGLVPVMGEIQA